MAKPGDGAGRALSTIGAPHRWKSAPSAGIPLDAESIRHQRPQSFAYSAAAACRKLRNKCSKCQVNLYTNRQCQTDTRQHLSHPQHPFTVKGRALYHRVGSSSHPLDSPPTFGSSSMYRKP